MIVVSHVKRTLGVVVVSILCQFICGVANAMDRGVVYVHEISVAQKLEPKGKPLRLRPMGEAEKVQNIKLEEKYPKLGVQSSTSPKNKIKVDQLTTPNFETVGTLQQEIGGLGLKMWRGTPRSLIDKLLPQIPNALRSPAMRDLARRLLLSTALVPSRNNQEVAGKKLIAMRVEQLQSMGLIGAATELISVVPNQDADPDLLRAKVDNMLLFNDLGGACEVVRHQKNRLVEGYWQRALVFCQALEGNIVGASLGASLLAEGGGADDPVFFSLVDVLTNGREVIVESLKKPTPLHLAMLRTANIRIPPNALDLESPALLRAIGVSPNASSNLRLDAAEWAAVMGAMPTERLGQIYAGAKFGLEELDNALTLAAAQRNSRGRALLYQAAVMQSVPMAKAAVLQQAWQLAREDSLYSLVVRLYEPMILDTPPLSGLAWFSADAARALLALRRPVEAQPWLNLLRKETLRNPDAKLELDALWAVIEVTTGTSEEKLDSGEFEAWQVALREIAPDEADSRVALCLAVFEALGYEIKSQYWSALLNKITWSKRSVPGTAVSRAMRDASSAGRIGETVLLALLVLGSDGPEGASPWHLHDVLVSLRAIGLESDARAIALEALLAAGL